MTRDAQRLSTEIRGEMRLTPFRRLRAGRLRRLPGSLVAASILLASAAPVMGLAADSGALWRVVHDLCVPDMSLWGRAAPCSKVDLANGYAVLKDREGATQLLLIPTTRVTGIEDPKLLSPESPNYWRLSWESRYLLDERAHRALPREDVGLAVNSIYGRSQNQLHIHIDCVRADVVHQLAAHMDKIGPQWRSLDVELAGRRYSARWMPEADLVADDPFKLLAELPGARFDMGRQTLALIGATSPANEPGFVLLADQADWGAGDRGHGEDLLDHSCRPIEAASDAAP
jgi:CDP-diacylglycerol pyrophosphatase